MQNKYLLFILVLLIYVKEYRVSCGTFRKIKSLIGVSSSSHHSSSRRSTNPREQRRNTDATNRPTQVHPEPQSNRAAQTSQQHNHHNRQSTTTSREQNRNNAAGNTPRQVNPQVNRTAQNSQQPAPQQTGTACTVCLEVLRPGEQIQTLNCNHKFHKACVEPWLRSNNFTCPNCRAIDTVLQAAAAAAAAAPQQQAQHEPENCAVCLEEMRSGQQIQELSCNHKFHSACIAPWLLSNHNSCPVCRRVDSHAHLGISPGARRAAQQLWNESSNSRQVSNNTGTNGRPPLHVPSIFGGNGRRPVSRTQSMPSGRNGQGWQANFSPADFEDYVEAEAGMSGNAHAQRQANHSNDPHSFTNTGYEYDEGGGLRLPTMEEVSNAARSVSSFIGNLLPSQRRLTILEEVQQQEERERARQSGSSWFSRLQSGFSNMPQGVHMPPNRQMPILPPQGNHAMLPQAHRMPMPMHPNGQMIPASHGIQPSGYGHGQGSFIFGAPPPHQQSEQFGAYDRWRQFVDMK